jgi:hypothetical protein
VSVDEDGTEVRDSGVLWADHEFNAEELTSVLEPAPLVPIPADVEALIDSNPQGMVDLDVFTNRSEWFDLVGVRYQQSLAMLRGEVETYDDLYAVKANTLAEWRAQGEAALAPVIASIEVLDGEVISANVLAGHLRASIPASAIPALKLNPGVYRVGLHIESEDDAILWEDNDRDDGGDLNTYVRPEPGAN